MRFVRGWIEYSALFKDGKLIGDIELVKHEEPQKLTDEELAESKARVAAQRKEMEERFRENRKKYPTAEQKLIDNIDRETKLVETIMDESDFSYAISNIRILIKEYREKTDTWYERTK
jgi:RNase adaptor protein for sRNA GlmZ degradation